MVIEFQNLKNAGNYSMHLKKFKCDFPEMDFFEFQNLTSPTTFDIADF